MKTTTLTTWLFRLALAALAALTTLGAAPAAQADALDDFIGLYQKIENKVGSGNLPISAKYLADSRDYIRCIANGNDTLVCTDQYHDTGAGKDLASQAGIPSGFWLALDSYVAYKQGDYWGAAWALGEAVACTALQILAAGVDLCGIVQELYEIAKGIYEGAGAVLAFLGDLGEAVWDGLSSAAESVCEGIGLCDGDDGPPLHVTLLKVIYAPRVQHGVQARESNDPAAFKPALLDKLAAQAMAWANNFYSAAMAMFSNSQKQDFLKQLEPHIKSSIATAEQGYTATVDAAWTGDITGRVVPELMKKRSEYVAQQIVPLAQLAAGKYLQGNNDPYWTARNQCKDHFVQTLNYGLIDRWIYHFPQKAAELKLKTHSDWCGETVWGANKHKFAEVFRNVIKAQVCTAGGTAIVCDSLADYRTCTGLMGKVEQAQQCQVNRTKLGKEAAAKIQADFKTKGSTLPCQTVVPPLYATLAGATSLVKLQCTRPTQRTACDTAYQQMFGDLPTKVLECSLQETPEYIVLKGKVAAAVNALNNQFGAGSFGIAPAGDPLLVGAASHEHMAMAQEAAQQDWGFGPPSAKTGFEYRPFVPKTIDGLSTPAIWKEVALPKVDKTLVKPSSVIDEKINPTELIDQVNNPVVNPIERAGKLSQTGKLAPAVGGMAALPAMPGAATTQQQQVMSGSLPPGSQPGSGPGQLAGQMRVPAGPVIAPLGQPDLAPAGLPRLGGQTVNWGGMVMLDAGRSVQRTAAGLCEFDLDYTVRNQGAAASGGFRTLWRGTESPGRPHAWMTLAAGGEGAARERIALRPGLTTLALGIDDLNQVTESNEANNQARIQVNLAGSCAPTRTLAPAAPARPTAPTLRPLPGTLTR
ncbi:MAG: CARDB domain-containing protein [Gallionellaceae bacterium]|nr:CARDB domain-containing protein [Gallionellaceae bacterium]